ncbi:MAG: tRNA pseudouridine(38-40) synthase TruA [Lachnospirales bacterium]
MKIILTMSYNGKRYHGWQKQKDTLTIQGELEKALKNIYEYDVSTIGASRTDSGVHALDQKAVYVVDNSKIPANKIYLALNKYLDDDIRVLNSSLIYDEFHPLLHVLNKTYKYYIYNNNISNPLFYHTYTYGKELDIDKMNKACKYFLGENDFAAFCSSGNSSKTTIRKINYLFIKKTDNIIEVEINGDGFLYNMVRIIVGTLIMVGLGKIEPEDIKNIITSKNRELCGKTVPASGLVLERVNLINLTDNFH